MAKRSSTSNRFLALLRGINVGGKNIIGKDALRDAFVDLGLEGVRTYIQSGNVLFRSTSASVPELTQAIERQLAQRFSYPARAVVWPYSRFKKVVDAAPPRWGKADDCKHNALFMLAGITPRRLMQQLPEPKAAIDELTVSPGVLFWSCRKRELTRSALMKVSGSPAYQWLTVRNHRTVFKLLALFEEL